MSFVYRTTSSIVFSALVSPCRNDSRRGKNSPGQSVPVWELSPSLVAQVANRPSPRLCDGGMMWKERFLVALI